MNLPIGRQERKVENGKLMVEQKIKSNGDVGIWHETYKVKAGEFECIYNNMSPFGFGKIGELIPAVGRREYAGDCIATPTV